MSSPVLDYDHSGFGTLTTEMLDSFRQSPTIVPNQPHETVGLIMEISEPQ